MDALKGWSPDEDVDILKAFGFRICVKDHLNLCLVPDGSEEAFGYFRTDALGLKQALEQLSDLVFSAFVCKSDGSFQKLISCVEDYRTKVVEGDWSKCKLNLANFNFRKGYVILDYGKIHVKVVDASNVALYVSVKPGNRINYSKVAYYGHGIHNLLIILKYAEQENKLKSFMKENNKLKGVLIETELALKKKIEDIIEKSGFTSVKVPSGRNA